MPSGISHVDRLEVVLRRIRGSAIQPGLGASRRWRGRRVGRVAAEVAGRRPTRRSSTRARGGPVGDDPAAVGPGAGAEVDDPVGRADHGLVVLDDDHAVALVAKPAQAGEQPVGVARVQAGRRLVEDVADAHQPRAELRRQPDPLQLAAGEGVGPPRQRQVAQADRSRNASRADDLATSGRADRLLRRVEASSDSKNRARPR